MSHVPWCPTANLTLRAWHHPAILLYPCARLGNAFHGFCHLSYTPYSLQPGHCHCGLVPNTFYCHRPLITPPRPCPTKPPRSPSTLAHAPLRVRADGGCSCSTRARNLPSSAGVAPACSGLRFLIYQHTPHRHCIHANNNKRMTLDVTRHPRQLLSGYNSKRARNT